MSNSVSDVFANLGLATQTPQKAPAQLGQSDFLRLMSTQLQNQDPLKPLDSQNFLAQLAQFSTVSGIQNLNDAFGSLSGALSSGQALQAASLVGQRVLAPAEALVVSGDGSGADAALDLAADAGAVRVNILDAGGATVRTLELGNLDAGLQRFHWDGTDASGNRVAAGTYRIAASGLAGGSTQALDTLAVSSVDSVTLGSDGLTLSLAGLGPVAFGDVRQIVAASH